MVNTGRLQVVNIGRLQVVNMRAAFDMPAWVCDKCSEQYFDAPIYKRLEEIAQQREQIQKTICFPLAEFDMATA